jgi:hypothetical protein
MNYFSAIVWFIIGFISGRLLPIIIKFKKFIEKEHDNKQTV